MIQTPYRYFACALLGAAGMAAFAQTLSPGDVAPPIRLSGWVKGIPFTLKRGRQYVIEFWSPSDAHCVQTMPNMTDSAKKYRDRVTFLGVAVDVRGRPPVARFLAKLGDRAGYPIAMDRGVGPGKGVTRKAWMVAAGMGAPRFIPTAFVVGADRRVRWIGSSFDLPDVLPRVLDSNWNVRQFAHIFRIQQDRMNRQYAMRHDPVLQKLAAAQAMIRQSRYRDAIVRIKAALAANGPHAQEAAKFGVPMELLAYRQLQDMRGYYVESRRASTIWSSNPHILNLLAWDILDPQSRLQVKDFALALKDAKRAVSLSGHRNPNLLDTLAWAYWDTGKRREAIAAEAAALSLAKGQDKQEMAATLKKFSGM